ncbi:MAG: hypothetical protein Q9160_004459 [Pyrenula sp. 1 TL-2023]
MEKQKQEGAKFGPEKANKMVQAQMKEQNKKLFEKHKVRPYLRYVPILQILAWLPFMDTLRCMAGRESLFLHSTEALRYLELDFESGGILWFDNLLAFDMTLTMLTALVSWLKISGIDTIKNFLSANKPGNEPTRQTAVGRALRRLLTFYALCIPIVGVVAQFPSALMLYWVSGTAFSIPTSTFFFRNVVGKKSTFKAAEKKEVEMTVRNSKNKIQSLRNNSR